MSHSETEITGFADMVITLLEHEEAALTEAGLDVKKLLAVLKALLQDTVRLASEQEELKVRTIGKTSELNITKKQLYVTASGTLDMAMGAASKNSDVAKNYQRIRSRMRRPERNG